MARKVDYDRLAKAIENSRRRMLAFREKYAERVRQMVGWNYSDAGAALPQPINYMELGCGIYTRAIAARNPASFVKPRRDPKLKPQAQILKAELDSTVNRMAMNITNQRWVKSALLSSMAVAKVGLGEAATVEIGGRKVRAGRPFFDTVSLDNFVIDMGETRFDRATYMGDMYRLPLQVVTDSGIYKNVDGISPQIFKRQNETGEDKVQSIGSGQERTEDETYFDYANLLDVWLPLEGKVCTFLMDDNWCIINPSKPIRHVEWTGPQDGPYHMLSFGEVPDNIMSLPPLALLQDLNQAANTLYRKMLAQAERQKTMLGAPKSNVADLNRVMKGRDGEAFAMDNPNAIKDVAVPGVDRGNIGFSVLLKDDINRFGGNLDQLGGLGTQAGTLGQEELLNSAASQRIQDMQSAMQGAVKKVLKSIAHYLHHDPLKNDTVFIRIPNTNIEITRQITPDDQAGDPSDFDFDIIPYSMQDRTPQQTIQALMQALNAIAPVSQMPGWNVPKIVELWAEYANMPELRDIYAVQSPEAMADGGGRSHEASPMAQNTTRRYIREGRSAANNQGRGANMAMAMMGSDPNPTSDY
jgi:hypothetical protein